jgi:hypothetical protein
MSSVIELRVRIEPWDDRGFVQAFETARDQVRAEGLTINGPDAAARAEALVRAAGYPAARVECDRTVEEALAHCAHWIVRRDGAPH